MTLRNIVLERREKTRKVPEQFAFLQLEQDDGGTVLDISEGGLRFESFAPVQEDGPIHFWFSLNLRERIEAWGELAWTDAERKSGGLKFLSISEAGRDQIREYLACSFPQKPLSTTVTGERDAVASFVSRARPRQSTLFSGKKESRAPRTPFAAANAETFASGVLVPMKRHLAVKRRQLIIGLLIGAAVAGIIAFAAVKLSQYLHENRAAAKPSVELPAPAGLPAGAPSVAPPVVNSTSADVFAIGNQKKGALLVRQPAALAPDASAHTSRTKNPLTPDQLWAMVQAGNGTAAAALAELYLKGEGVPQNCAQARVLLLVASEKHNAAAIRRLADLDKQGCPAN
jgi:PilZ domain